MIRASKTGSTQTNASKAIAQYQEELLCAVQSIAKKNYSGFPSLFRAIDISSYRSVAIVPLA